MNGKRSHNFRVFINTLAYFILVAVAIMMVVSRFVLKDVSVMLENIIKYMTLFWISMAALWYAISKRNSIFKIVWFVAVAGIIVLMFI